MKYAYEPYDGAEFSGAIAAQAEKSERLAFIRRTYGHLAGAILAFVALELVFFIITTVDMRRQLLGTIASSPIYLLVFLGAFIGFGYMAQVWANRATSPGMAYAGLGLYVVLEALIFLPILIVAADYIQDPSLIPTAGIMTLLVFGGLTAGVFITKQDFSFLGSILWIASFAAIGLIVCGMLFGFGLGVWFSVAMIALACGFILYDTSNVLHHYRTDQHVAAALALFAAVAVLFFYILRLLMATRD